MKNRLLIAILSIVLSLISSSLFAQVVNGTAEDTLYKGFASFLGNTTIGGYGNAFYQRNSNLGTSTVNLERFVLFVGHRFNNKISFFSELEVEDAKVAGGEEGGELALEQCYLKFNFNQNHYLVAGLFLPRIGIMNENHLPNTFNGNERTEVETFIIPSTWRELGIGYYGSMTRLPLSYSLALINGLNASGFEHGSGIREGRFEGREATANNLAVTGSLQFYKNNFSAQLSGYYGGTAGIASGKADSLKLTSGIFGTPVIIGEADLQYEAKGFFVKILGSIVSIPNASDINRAYASNTPQSEYGAYAEIGYDIFNAIKKIQEQEMIVFLRYENLNINASIPENGITDGTLKQQHLITGFSYLPIKNVVIKADARLLHTGEQNPELILNPNPVAQPYDANNVFLNLGIGFSF